MKVICISHFPDKNTTTDDIVPSMRKNAKKLIDSCTGKLLPPHRDLVAMPASSVDESPKAQDITWPILTKPTKNSVTVASFGIENHWKDYPPLKEKFPEITEENQDFTTIDELLEFHQNNPKTVKYGEQEIRTVMRHYCERYPQYKDHAWIVLNCLDMTDPYHDKNLRDHTGYHPQTMLDFARKIHKKEVDHLTHHIFDWYQVQGTEETLDKKRNNTSAEKRDVLILCICKKERHRSVAARCLLQYCLAETFPNITVKSGPQVHFSRRMCVRQHGGCKICIGDFETETEEEASKFRETVLKASTRGVSAAATTAEKDAAKY